MNPRQTLLAAGFDWLDLMRFENGLDRQGIHGRKKQKVLGLVVEFIRATCERPEPEPEPPACMNRM